MFWSIGCDFGPNYPPSVVIFGSTFFQKVVFGPTFFQKVVKRLLKGCVKNYSTYIISKYAKSEEKKCK